MKKPGDCSKYTVEQRYEIAMEYINSNIGLKEIAIKYHVTPATIRNYVNKVQAQDQKGVAVYSGATA